MIASERRINRANTSMSRAVVSIILVTLLVCSAWTAAEEGPIGVHLALTGQGADVVAAWSLPNTPLSSAPLSRCEWRAAADVNSAAAESSTYTAGGFAGTLFKCAMTGLAYDTRYEYLVGCAANMSSQFSFQTPPNPNDPASSMRAVVWGDMGIQNPVASSVHTQAAAQREIQTNGVPLVINVGDTSYADDYTEKGPNHWVLDQFWHEVEGIAAHAPVMLCPGNHEDQYHFAAHLNRTHMPVQGTGPLSRFYYSFDYGPVHFLTFSTEHSIDKGGEQWTFAVDDLRRAAANRQRVPWIVVFTHHPFYCSDTLTKASRCGYEMDHYLAQFEDVFKDMGVDLFMAGHNHMYERSWPVYKRQPTKTLHRPNATVYVVDGAAGDIEGTEFLLERDTVWRAAGQHVPYTGYGRMSANHTALRYEHFDARTGQRKDDFTLTK